jgi:hypothetical protein
VLQILSKKILSVANTFKEDSRCCKYFGKFSYRPHVADKAGLPIADSESRFQTIYRKKMHLQASPLLHNYIGNKNKDTDLPIKVVLSQKEQTSSSAVDQISLRRGVLSFPRIRDYIESLKRKQRKN